MILSETVSESLACAIADILELGCAINRHDYPGNIKTKATFAIRSLVDSGLPIETAMDSCRQAITAGNSLFHIDFSIRNLTSIAIGLCDDDLHIALRETAERIWVTCHNAGLDDADWEQICTPAKIVANVRYEV